MPVLPRTRFEAGACAALASACLLAGCGGERADSSLSPSARPELVEALRADLAAPRHPSDGGGRAWIAEGPAEVTAGATGRWVVVYEAGELGIAPGGMLLLQVPPFWGWSTPQTLRPEGPGYTTVETAAEGVTLDAGTLDQTLLGIRIGGRALAAGERVTIAYGDGPAGARADRFAERRSPFWIAVDGDGDGVRGLVADPPAVDVVAGPPARLVLLLPTTAQPGEEVRLTVAVLDALGNAGVPFAGEVQLRGPEKGLDFPPAVAFEPGAGGRKTVALTAREPGIYRLVGEVASGPAAAAGTAGEGEPAPLPLPPLAARTNPVVVADALTRVLWGDLHGHSGISDGTGTPEDYFLYARDVAALDVAALTDHDHWGMEPLSRHPEHWREIRRQVARFHQPGRFVTLLGYEWTNWLHGHRHVLYFDRPAAGEEGGGEGPGGDAVEVFSAVDPAYDHPEELWAALRGLEALTFAHHSAGGPVATNWEIPPDPELEPVTEVVSVHGSSEAADSPGLIYDPVPGNTVRDALGRGYRLGLIGSGDSHDGHPGLAGLASPSTGLAAILTSEVTRAGVLAALRERRVYATNGPRLLLLATLDGRPMGAEVEPGSRWLTAWIVAPAPIGRVDLVRGGEVAESVPGGGEGELRFSREIRDLESGEFVYLRVVQDDGGAAWSSPFFVR